MKQTFCTLFAKSLTAVIFILFTACTHKNADQISAQIDFWSFPNLLWERGDRAVLKKALMKRLEKKTLQFKYTLLSLILPTVPHKSKKP